MKNFLLIFCAVLFASTVMAQTVTLTFTGQDVNGNHLKLNSVTVRNITQGWQETIYAPDTTLTVDDVTKITENEINGTFVLSQNNPNPYDGTTKVTLTTAKSDVVKLDVSDINGRILDTWSNVLQQPGQHLFRISTMSAGTYILRANQAGNSSSIKMINRGQGAENKITYEGEEGKCAVIETKAVCSNAFALGDQMEYYGYATIGGTEVESNHLVQEQNDLDPIVILFPAPQITLPTVVTGAANYITDSSAICQGTVVYDGGTDVTARGFCWSTEQNPTLNDNYSVDSVGIGAFTHIIAGLADTTTYYVRAYATNSEGTAYGNQISFTTDSVPVIYGQSCPSVSMIMDFDGNIYNTVQIGQQCWMKENLRTTHYANGDSISLGSAASFTTAYYFYPGNNSNNTSSYGCLYNWPAVMNNSSPSSSFPSGVQGICPTGWHMPSDSEWIQLTGYVRSQSQYICGSNNYAIAKALASTTGWRSYNTTCCIGNSQSSNNATGFSAVSAGNFTGQYYSSTGDEAIFWSTSGDGVTTAKYWGLSYHLSNVEGGYSHALFKGFSVRCLKNEEDTSSLAVVATTMVSDITQTSVTCGGYVMIDGGANVTDRGVCYNTTGTPTTSDSCVHIGTGTGVFALNLTDLDSNTTYYIRAFATNSVGVAYGSSIQFTTTNHPLPTVATDSVSDITYTTATCGGNVVSAGGTIVTDRGICYNTSGTPTISDNCIHIGAGTGAFSQNITGLDTNTTYYVRAFAINSVGLAYGPSVQFTTADSILPTVTTASVTNIGYTTATCGGTVTDDGRSNVTNRGVCYNTTGTPTISDNCVHIGAGIGIFSQSIAVLDTNTTYYLRAYAINGVGIAYGNEVTFITASPVSGLPCADAATVMDYDGNIYNTVQIGNQCWMRENLRTTHYANGESIDLGNASSYYAPSRYYPDCDSANVNTYGYLYNWRAVMKNSSSSNLNPSGVQGICPTGWHVPSDAEWTQLVNYVRTYSPYFCDNNYLYVAKALCSTTGWNSSSSTCCVGNNPNDNNATGFSAVPAGVYYNGSCTDFGEEEYFWSSTSYYRWSCVYNNPTVWRWSGSGGNNGYSVRCLKN